MTKQDPHTAAAQALRTTLQRCVRGLIAELDREGRAAMRIACTRIEGRAQVDMADKLRKRAEKAGL